MKIIKILLILIIVNFSNILAEEFTATIDSGKILIGGRAVLTLKAVSDDKVVFPALGDSISGVKIISKSQIDTSKQGDSLILTQKIYLTAFNSGTYQISPLTFISIDKNSNTNIHNTHPLSVNVIDADISQMKDINDIKDIIKENKTIGDYWLWFLIAGLMMLIILIYFIFFKGKKSMQPKKEVVREIIIDPKKWLTDELNSLKQKELWKTEQYKIHYSVLSDAFRRYFELKYQIPTMEQTTSEVESSVKGKTDDATLAELIQLLSKSDLVKFAKYIPSNADAVNDLNAAFDINQKI